MEVSFHTHSEIQQNPTADKIINVYAVIHAVTHICLSYYIKRKF